MIPRFSPGRIPRPFFILLGLLIFLAGCERPDPETGLVPTTAPTETPAAVLPTIDPALLLAPPTPIIHTPVAEPAPAYFGTPTPDPTRTTDNGDQGMHVVSFGETLGYIAQLYGSTIEELLQLNDLNLNDFIYVGQEIRLPVQAELTGSSFKIIPDSELVYGPMARAFDMRGAIATHDGYLHRYQEEVEGRLLDGPAIVQLVADRYSVNPRLLLTILEYRSSWLTQSMVIDDGHPLGHLGPGSRGRYNQLGWAANLFNLGYYGRAEGGRTGLVISDNTRVRFAPDINDGTAGVQTMLATHSNATWESWQTDVSPTGFFAAFSRLFGNPFAYTYDPLWPADIQQPALRLPWADGETWYFTGGPHGGWASGSAWAALDFVPHHEQLGCYPSDAWVRAMAPGLVVRSDMGAVVVDLDGDAYAGTGWVIVYMHIETRDRVPVGTYVQTGDPIGHPSCEGGFSNGTHVHVARMFNGRWVSADGWLPFTMDGWLSQGTGREYNGSLVKGDTIKVACQCREERNAITAE
jgi:murein DD-endopeptidase MepM/ murein hydrolase activator NlpD